MTTRTFVLTALLAVIAAGPAALAQGTQHNESDQEFLTRMQSEFNRLERRIANLQKTVESTMGRSTGTGTSFGIDTSGQDRRARDPMDSEMRSMRSKLRSLGSKLDKDRDRMVEGYRTRNEEEFDRGHWEGYVRRLNFDLDEMERDLRNPYSR